jgi:hypothetical protein
MHEVEFPHRLKALLAGRDENQFLFIHNDLRENTQSLGEEHHVLCRFGHPRAGAARVADETHVRLEHI